MEILLRLILLIVGYGFGLFQTGYLYGKLTGVNLKEKGSGNTGATNALRVLGIKGGLIVFFFDALKAFIPCFLVAKVIPWGGSSALPYALMAWTALGVSLGNDYPFYLHFRGGKGVAVASGMGIAWDFFTWGISMATFFLISFTTRFVSVASMVSILVAFGLSFLFGANTFTEGMFSPNAIEFYVVLFLIAALLIFRHKENIIRLLHGTENRFGKKKEST